MIFRMLYKRRLVRLFGRYVNASGLALLDKHASEISEWKALRFLLPIRWFHSDEEIANALMQVQRMATRVLAESENKPRPGDSVGE